MGDPEKMGELNEDDERRKVALDLGLDENATQVEIDVTYNWYENLSDSEREKIHTEKLKIAEAKRAADAQKGKSIDRAPRHNPLPPRHLEAKVELPLPSSKVPTQENIESGEMLEGNQLWRYLKKNEKDKNLGMVATDMGFSGNDWIAFLEEDDGSVKAVQIYSAGSYNEKFIKRIVGFGETSKYSSNSGLETADEICKKLAK